MEMCKEIEICQEKGDSFNLHKKVKEVVGNRRKKPIKFLTNNEGKVITNKQEVKQMWEAYIKQLFHDNRSNKPIIEGESGLTILEDEVKTAVKNAKDQKAVGPDGIPTEIIKLFEGENVKWLMAIFNKIYESGLIPQEWLKSEFITLPKKPEAIKCNDFRTILVTHTSPVLVR